MPLSLLQCSDEPVALYRIDALTVADTDPESDDIRCTAK